VTVRGQLRHRTWRRERRARGARRRT
jgi:hypothetical protein